MQQRSANPASSLGKPGKRERLPGAWRDWERVWVANGFTRWKIGLTRPARQTRRTREGGDPFQQLNLLTIYGHKRTQRPQKDESRRFNHSSCPPNTPNTRRWRPVSTIQPFNDLWPQEGTKTTKR